MALTSCCPILSVIIFVIKQIWYLWFQTETDSTRSWQHLLINFHLLIYLTIYLIHNLLVGWKPGACDNNVANEVLVGCDALCSVTE